MPHANLPTKPIVIEEHRDANGKLHFEQRQHGGTRTVEQLEPRSRFAFCCIPFPSTKHIEDGNERHVKRRTAIRHPNHQHPTNNKG